MKRRIKIFFSSDKLQAYPFKGCDSSFPEFEKVPLITLTGVGRSGTHFYAELLGRSPSVSAFHLDEIGNSVGDSFHQYTRWYNLPVDPEGMLHSRRFLAHKVNEANKILLESNPYLTLHLEDFASEFDSKIVIVYRDPKKVIESHYNKGWYQDFTPVLKKGYSAPGFQYTHEKAHYSFGRLFPNNELELSQWIKLSVVGKIAWYWKTIYSKIIEQVKNLEHVCLIRTDAIDYHNYKLLSDFLEIDPVDVGAFDKILTSKPGKGTYTSRPKWDKLETDEFRISISDVFNELENHSKRLF